MYSNRLRSIPAITPRSSFSFADDTYWFRTKFNEQSGTTFVCEGKDSGGVFSDIETVPGTTTNLRDPSGSVESGGNNAVELTHNMSDICRTDNLNGTIMVFQRYGGNGAGATGNDMCCAYRNPFGSEGWGLRFLNNLRPQFGFNEIGQTGVSVAGLAGSEFTDISGAVEGCVGLIYGDGVNDLEAIIYGKGVQLQSGSIALTQDDVSGHFSVFGRFNDAGTNTQQLTAGILFDDVLVIRTPQDLRPYAGRIATEYEGNRWEMLKSLYDIGV